MQKIAAPNLIRALMPFMQRAAPYAKDMLGRAFSFSSKPIKMPAAVPSWYDVPVMGADLAFGASGVTLPYWLYKYPKTTAAFTWGLPAAVNAVFGNSSPPGAQRGGQPSSAFLLAPSEAELRKKPFGIARPDIVNSLMPPLRSSSTFRRVPLLYGRV